MESPQYEQIQSEIRDLEEGLTKHKFIVNSNTKLIREIKLFIDEKFTHHLCETEDYDDGHRFGWDKKCVIYENIWEKILMRKRSPV